MREIPIVNFQVIFHINISGKYTFSFSFHVLNGKIQVLYFFQISISSFSELCKARGDNCSLVNYSDHQYTCLCLLGVKIGDTVKLLNKGHPFCGHYWGVATPKGFYLVKNNMLA